jgi:transposase
MKLEDLVTHVVGVDTHKETHTGAVVTATTGGFERIEEVVANRDGYEALLELADGYGDACDRAWAIEGTGSYGAGLAEFLKRRGEWVIEIDRPTRAAQRDGAKSDPLDAVRAAREALSRNKWAEPRARGEREAMRVLVTTREGAVRDRTRATNQLKAMIVSAPDDLRFKLRDHNRPALVDTCARLRRNTSRGEDYNATVAALARLAKRIQSLNREIKDHDRDINKLTEQHCPQLLAEFGVGPIVAAQTYIAWSHPGRCRDEAAFANLAGTAPIAASSGKTVRYRLNRGGDRQLNRALHTVVLARARSDEPTQLYIKQRLADGKTEREARRCLKRYIGRRFYRLLEHPPDRDDPDEISESRPRTS